MTERENKRREVSVLNRPDGGLSLTYNWAPPAPAENVDAVLTAMQESAGYRR